jgi:hypothetical protein
MGQAHTKRWRSLKKSERFEKNLHKIRLHIHRFSHFNSFRVDPSNLAIFVKKTSFKIQFLQIKSCPGLPDQKSQFWYILENLT